MPKHEEQSDMQFLVSVIDNTEAIEAGRKYMRAGSADLA